MHIIIGVLVIGLGLYVAETVMSLFSSYEQDERQTLEQTLSR